MEVRVVSRAVGPVSEADVKLVAGSSTPGIIVGFNIKVEPQARDLAERQGVTIETFDIIYKLAEWLGEELEKRRPREQVEELLGAAKILKFFSATKGRVVVGGRVEEGEIADGAEVKVLRRDIELGRGKIVSLQSQKREVKKVEKGEEFGTQLKIDVEPAAGDRLEVFKVVVK
jgi:translation initiation factor IF-2